VHKLVAVTGAYLEGGAITLGFVRFEGTADTVIEPAWATYLQTETGEPLQAPDGTFLEDS
jgi:hypothetical protein